MRDLQRLPEVRCTNCNKEVYLAASGIYDDRHTVNFVPACDCQMWFEDGEVPKSWVDKVIDD